MDEFKAEGAKDVAQAVLIAALSALATGLLNWGLEHFKEQAKAKSQSKASE